MPRYSVEPRDQIFIKSYDFSLLLKIWVKTSKNVSSKYSQKLLDHAKRSATDALKTASKRAIQKTAEAAGDLIGNKIADKSTRVSKTSPQNNSETNAGEIPSER